MKFNKLLALLLALSMLICCFAACHKDEEKDDESSNDEDVTVSIEGLDEETHVGIALPTPQPEFPSADFNGEEFTFLSIKLLSSGRDYYGGHYIDSHALCGDKISDAVYRRNLDVEEKYNVKITEKEEITPDVASKLKMYQMSGDYCFDAIYGWGYKMASCIPDGYFADFSSLPNVDLTKEYWAPSAIEDLMICDSVYLAINDISMNRLDWASLVFFNKSVYENNMIDKIFGDIYQLVRDGKWTLEMFLQMIKTVSRDLDGDGQVTKDDVFGLIDSSCTGASLLSGLGVTLTSKNDDGTHSLSFYSDKTIMIIDKLSDIFSDSRYVKSYPEILNGADITGFDDQWQYARSVFTTDHSLFLIGALNSTSETAFRNMESRYGIVPMPKYDETQKNYVSEVTELASLFAIPATLRNDEKAQGSMERTGMILEYMAYKSNEMVLPFYFDEALRGERLDANDAEMFDIIAATTHYELAKLCSSSDDVTAYDTVQMMFDSPNAAASIYNSRKRKLQNDLDEYFTKVLKLQANKQN